MAQYGIVKASINDMIGLGRVMSAGWHDSNQTRANGLLDLQTALMLANGINPRTMVNDCETLADWTESDNGVLDATLDSSNNKIGSGALLITNTAATDGTQNIETTVINAGAAVPSDAFGETGQLDWDGYDYMVFWTYGGGAGHYSEAGELKLNIKNNGAWGTAVNIPAPIGTNAVHQRKEVDITSFTRNQVEAIRFESNNPNTSEAVTIDDIWVCKFVTGRGELMGKCSPYIIKSGTAFTRGQIAEFEAGSTHRADVEAAVGVETIGPVSIEGTGDAAGTVFAWIQDHGLVYLRVNAATVNGESLIWQSDNATHGHLVQGGATGVDENSFAKGLEAAGAQFDDIIAFIAQAPSFVS